MTRPRSNALIPGDPRMPNWRNPNYRLNIPNAGPYRHDPSGYMLFGGARKTPAEGWKFHISAHPHNAEELAKVVLPLLTKMQVWHKYLELHKLGTRSREAVGKFIAYYPISAKDAHEIAGAVSRCLGLANMRNMQGPVIHGERSFGDTGILYTRYGSFQYEYIKGPPKTRTCSSDPARSIRSYHRAGRVRPSWIRDLTEDSSEALFPSYDARRELRGLKESDKEWVN